MSILRNEIPRPLDLQYMLDLMSNPNLILLTSNNSTTTTTSTTTNNTTTTTTNTTTTTKTLASMFAYDSSQTSSTSKLPTTTTNNNPSTNINNLSRPGSSVSTVSLFTVPKPPPLLSTHTNDGTTCVYYPSGHLAMVVANVFGFFVEGGSSSSTANMQPTSFHTAQSMFSDGTSSKLNINNPVLVLNQFHALLKLVFF